MTPDEQRIAIAEALGWTEFISPANFSTPIGKDVKGDFNFLPDFLKSLDACAEMEKALFKKGDQWTSYYEVLDEISDRDDNDSRSATASQRCEAFLRTLSLWQPQPAS
jgi:hypothetical protein